MCPSNWIINAESGQFDSGAEEKTWIVTGRHRKRKRERGLLYIQPQAQVCAGN